MKIQPPWACCAECGLPYSDDGWVEVIVENKVWPKIAPDRGNGLLCFNCIARSLKRHALKGVKIRILSDLFTVVYAEEQTRRPARAPRRRER